MRTHPPVASAKRRVEEVNEEPSKQGLGEIYESEYKKQVGRSATCNMQPSDSRGRSAVAQSRAAYGVHTVALGAVCRRSLALLEGPTLPWQVMGEKETDELKVVHTELDGVWKKLCHKLDALSNFHFTPKPVIDEMTVHANVAAIKMVMRL